MGKRGVAMRELVGARRFDRLDEFRVLAAELLGLASVVAVDNFFDRDGAGHRRPLAEQRRRRSKRKAGDVPERRQRSRPHVALGEETVELAEMALLLLRHLVDRARSAAAADDRELPGIDACRAVLAGLIDADHSRRVVHRHPVAGQVGWTFDGHAATREKLRRRAAKPQNAAIASDARRFQPASEIPNSDH